MKHLPINLDTFSFYSREVVNGKVLKNRCGRDFLYYALVYKRNSEYGKGKIEANQLEQNGDFGVSVPAWLAWIQIQFMKVHKYLKKKDLYLKINNRRIYSFFTFISAILFSRISFQDAMLCVESNIDERFVVGIDVSIGFGGLLDHVMFVYGYDDKNLYVFETTNTPINYTSISNKYPQVMQLPKAEIQKRWTRFGRVWEVKDVVRNIAV